MNNARAAILGRLSAAPPGRVPAPPITVPLPAMPDGPYARFCELLTNNRAELIETTLADWDRAAADWLAAAGCRNLLYGPDTEIAARLTTRPPADIALIPYDATVETLKPALVREVDAAITGSRGAIAATGSIILWPSPREPRLMSLLPPNHLVLVRKSSLRLTLGETMAAEGWAESGMPTNVVLLSGPSKTADIAQILAFGVHGPKRLAVLVMRDV